jgi:hypothetical protein
MNDEDRIKQLKDAVNFLFNYSLEVTVGAATLKDAKKRGKLHEHFFQLNQKAKEMREILDMIDQEIN